MVSICRYNFFLLKNTIRDGGSTALRAVYTVTVDTVDMVYTVGTVGMA